MSPEATVRGSVASEALRPTPPQNARRSQIVDLYRTNSQTQTETCDYDGIQAGSVDLRISQRD